MNLFRQLRDVYAFRFILPLKLVMGPSMSDDDADKDL